MVVYVFPKFRQNLRSSAIFRVDLAWNYPHVFYWFGAFQSCLAFIQRMNQGYKPHIELPNPSGPGVQTVQVPVPAQKCGLVIGKGL